MFGSSRSWRWLGALVALAGALPLVVTAPTPLQDWPSHLARVWITDQVLNGSAFWSARYAFQGFLIPNAVLDMGVLGLMKLGLGIDAAGTVFLLLLYAVFVSGFCTLSSRVAGFSALTIPLAVTCFYNVTLFFGLVNFLSGVGLLLWFLVAWQASAGRWVRRALVAVPCVAAIAICHLLTAFMFVGIVGLLDLIAFVRRRPRRVTELLPPGVALLTAAGALLLSPVGDDRLDSVGRSHLGVVHFVLGKAATFCRAMLSGQIGPDAILLLTVLLLAGVYVFAARRVAVEWAIVIAALVVVTILAPFSIGEGTFIDARLSTLPIIFLALCLAPRRRIAWLGPAVAVLVIARLGLLAGDWRQYGRFYQGMEAAMARLPVGSTLMAGRGDLMETPVAEPSSARAWAVAALTYFDQWTPPIRNIASLGVRHGVFVPSVFASRVQQPLYLRREWQPPWSSYPNLNTQELLDEAVQQARTDCRPGIQTNLILIYKYPHAELGLPQLAGLPPELQSRFRIINVC